MFKVVRFDKNNDADNVCKELFEKAPVLKKKVRVKNGKITKKSIKKKNDVSNEEKIKEEIRAILQSNVNAVATKKKKAKLVEDKKNNSAVLENKGNVDGSQQKKGKKWKKKKFQEEKQVETEEVATRKRHKKKKKLKKKPFEPTNQNESEIVPSSVNPQKPEIRLSYKQRKGEKFKDKLRQTLNLLPEKKQKTKHLTLRERMMQKLQAARFRYINEQIYSADSKQAQKIFTEDPEAFEAYHDGYRQQVNKWPLNPADVIIKSIQRLPKTHIIADFGCGDAKLAKSVTQKVHSFDLVAANDLVTACDMAHAPLQNGSVDVVVFCLSLMGTNLHEYLLEANRVLKLGGILKIAEVESRFDDVNQFIEAVKRFNFKNTWTDLSHNLFYFLDFKKEANVKNKRKLPTVSLQPCLYKKR